MCHTDKDRNRLDPLKRAARTVRAEHKDKLAALEEKTAMRETPVGWMADRYTTRLRGDGQYELLGTDEDRLCVLMHGSKEEIETIASILN
jgi:hypothetical protein